VGNFEEMCTLHAVIMLRFCASTGLSSWRIVLGDLVDVAAWGIVPCVFKIDTLGLFHSLLKLTRLEIKGQTDSWP
jgi:hypothetical protein